MSLQMFRVFLPSREKVVKAKSKKDAEWEAISDWVDEAQSAEFYETVSSERE